MYEISALTHDGCKQLARDIYTHIHAELCKEQPPAPADIDPRFAEIEAAADAATDAITNAVTDTAATAEPSAPKTRKPRAPRKTAS